MSDIVGLMSWGFSHSGSADASARSLPARDRVTSLNGDHPGIRT
jgi:hypothetical protein